MSEWRRLQKTVCSSTKKFSWPTISVRLLALIRSRDTRGKPSGSSFFADKNDETGVMLRVGKLVTDVNWRSFCDDMNTDGMDEVDVPIEVPEVAVDGRDEFCETALSRSVTLSAKAIIRLAMP